MHMKAYRLIGYEIGTDEKVIDWRDVIPTWRFQRGDVIEDGAARWEVVGVRQRSTEDRWLVDVRRIPTPL